MSAVVIEPGDYVRHKTLNRVSGGLKVSVMDVSDTHAQITYFDCDNGMLYKIEWFELKDLELLEKAKGGFITL